jgi:UDP-N-acetylmuramate--alanine ligase
MIMAQAAAPSIRTTQGPRPGRAHLIGIAGSGMRNLARALRQQGWHVTGSDPAGHQPLPGIFCSHDPDHVPHDADLVVASDAVPPENCERQRAVQLGLPVLSYAQMLGQLMQSSHGIAVAGTHGKSTTCAMAHDILLASGLDTLAVFGAEPLLGTPSLQAQYPDSPMGQPQPRAMRIHKSSDRAPKNRANSHDGSARPTQKAPLVLVEACEYRANFLHLNPRWSTILNIEPDHFDCYPTHETLLRAFTQFAQNTHSDGMVLSFRHCTAAQSATDDVACRRESFGFSADCDWRAVEVRGIRGYYAFRILRRGDPVCCIQLHVPGRHQVICALAAAGLSWEAGASPQAIRRGLESYRGLRRRLEWRGSPFGVSLFDDYAHHPTEVTATVAAVRELVPGGRIWCVLEPHQVSRTKPLLDRFIDSLRGADRVYVAEIFRAREGPCRAGDLCAADVADRARQLGVSVRDEHDLDRIAGELAASIRGGELTAGDAVLTMGAGDVGTVTDRLAELGKLEP